MLSFRSFRLDDGFKFEVARCVAIKEKLDALVAVGFQQTYWLCRLLHRWI